MCYLHFSGFVDPSKIKDFHEHRDQFINASKTTNFLDAVKDIDNYIKNTKVIYLYIHVYSGFD